MKTLKKTLCLVLAVVMVVGVLIIPAGAADYKDYTDKEDIKHEEAVKVLTYLEIVSGTGSGFDPNGKLNRAAGATMLARMMLTRKGADGLPVSETFDDVESAGYSWAAGAISYGVMNGYIRGHGNGKFDPAGALTGYQLAKMLLVAIGYAEPEKYDGAGYETKVYLDATDAGLLDGLTGIDPTKGLTRDDAAQMMFSAMNWSKVASTTKAYAVFEESTEGTDVRKDTYDTFIEAYLAVEQHNKGTGAKWYVKSVDPKTGSIIGDKYGLSVGEKTDDFKRVSKSWEKDNKPVVVLDFVADLEYQGGVTERTVLSAMGINTPGEKVKFNVYEDGGNNAPREDRENKTDNKDSFGGRGSTVQVEIVDDDEANVFVINTYAYQLKEENIIPAQAAVPGVSAAVKAQIVLPNAEHFEDQNISDNPLSFETAEFEKNDVVLYNIAGNKAVGVVKAPVLETGKIVRIDSNGMKINNKTYTKSGKVSTDTDTALSSVSIGKSYVFYGDNQKNIILATDVASKEAAPKNYIYVFDFAAKKESSTGGSDLFGTGATTSAAQAQAKVIHLDTGINEIVDVAVTQSGGKWCLVTSTGTADTTVGHEVDDDLEMPSGIHAFTLRNDGTYAIDYAAEASASDLTGTLKIKKDTVTTGAKVGTANLIVNSSTEVSVLTLAKNSSSKIVGGDVNYYKGVSNFPNNAVETKTSGFSGNEALFVEKEDGVASRIIIVFAAPDNSESVPLALYLGKGGTVLNAAGNGEVQLYKFLIDGEVVELADDATSSNSATLIDDNKGKVYSFKVENDAIKGSMGTAKDGINTVNSGDAIKSIESSYIVVGENNVVVKLASDCVFVYEKGGNYTVLSALNKTKHEIKAVYTNGAADGTDKDAQLIIVKDKAAG